MVFQVEHHLVHGDVSFEDHSARIVKDKTRDQAEHQVTIMGLQPQTLDNVTCYIIRFIASRRLWHADHAWS